MLPADSPFASLPAPGPHPAPTELRAYAAGTLAPAEQHRIEAHALECERCADVLAGFSMTDAPATEQAIAELRARLQARVGTEEPVPAPGPRAWPRLAAAAALLGAVAGGVWVWEQPRAAAPTVATAPPTKAAQPAQPVAADVAAPKPATAAAAGAAAPVAAPAAPAGHGREYAAVVRPAAKRRPPAGRRITSAVVVADQEAPPDNSDPDAFATAETAPAAPPLRTAKAKAAVAAPDAAGRAAPAGPADSMPAAARAAPEPAFSQDKALAKTALPDNPVARMAASPMPAALAINPAPVGGSLALRQYLRREAAAFEPEINALRIAGSVRVRVLVGADGKIIQLKVTRGMRPDYDAEALRIVCDGPAWQPGVAGGRRATLPVELTVPF